MSHYTGSVPGTEPAGQWVKQAACKADPEAMYPGTSEGEIEYAKGFCRTCPVVERCGQWAYENREEHGVWGGLSEAERRAQLRRRGIRVGHRGKKDDQAEQEKPAPKKIGRPPAECGTPSAYDRHIRNGEPADVACRKAHAERTARYRATGSTKAAA